MRIGLLYIFVRFDDTQSTLCTAKVADKLEASAFVYSLLLRAFRCRPTVRVLNFLTVSFVFAFVLDLAYFPVAIAYGTAAATSVSIAANVTPMHGCLDITQMCLYSAGSLRVDAIMQTRGVHGGWGRRESRGIRGFLADVGMNVAGIPRGWI